MVQAKITTQLYQNTALIQGTPGAFTKILRTGDPLPGTAATWTPTRTSPSFYSQEDLPTTRNGDPMIKALTADDAQGYIGLYRNGIWENTQVVGIPAPGFGAGKNFNIGGIKVFGGNSAGQFVFTASIFQGANLTVDNAAYVGQNGTLQLIVKTGDILPGDPRRVAVTFYPGSINNSGTVVFTGIYNGAAGYVYRWSAAGGATKVIADGDSIPSIGPNAVFIGPETFQLPLINANGAVLFFGKVNIAGPSGIGSAGRDVLLYQSAPGAPVEKVVMAGDTIAGLPEGTVALLDGDYSFNFNDAGQIAFYCDSTANSKEAARSGSFSGVLSGGTAPNISVIAREDTPAPIDGLSGSRTFRRLLPPSFNGLYANRVSGESGVFLSDQGEIPFNGSIGATFGDTTVFQARLNNAQTSPLAVQTIRFSQPFNRAATAGTLSLNATSSSGLPVSFALVSGPATLAGNVLSFSGVAGEVVVRATQAGNASFIAAEPIDRTIIVQSSASQLPPAGTASPSPVMLPLASGPDTIYSGALTPGYLYTTGPTSLVGNTNTNDSRIFADGTVNFKDALTDDVITTATNPVRLNFSSSTTTGVTALPGEILDSSVATVTGKSPTDEFFVRTFLRPRNSSLLTKLVIAKGTPGNFTKLLQTGDVLPGTTSVYGSTSIPGSVEPPITTRGGMPWVSASAPDGLSSHIGIYRNSAWETTQIFGIRPPGGFAVGTKFSDVAYQAANSAGDFVFRSSVVTASNTAAGGGLFHGKNGVLSLIASTGSILSGDPRAITSILCSSLNSSGEAAVYGGYTSGGFVHRWTPAGGFTNVLRRGDFITALGTNIVFDFATRPPILNDAGALVVLAQIADRNPTTGVLSNFRSALLFQSANNSPIQKILVAGEVVPGSPADLGPLLSGSIEAIQLNNSGQIAIFARATGTGSGSPNIVYGGTLPNLSYVMKDGWIDIAGVGTRSVSFETLAARVDGVTGDSGSSLSNSGEFVFRGSYSNIGLNGASGVFKASVFPTPPAPQAITFSAPADRLINSAAFNLTATSASGLAITYQLISGPATLSGSLLTPGASTGIVTVRATQAGNASFLAATPVERSFRLLASASEVAMSQYLAAANVPPADRLATLDLDSDGIVNLLEFALGGNPLLADSQRLPTVQLSGGVLSFSYVRAQGSSVIYTVKTAPDLNSAWTTTGVTQGISGPGGITIATLNSSSGTRGFLRLEVSLAP